MLRLCFVDVAHHDKGYNYLRRRGANGVYTYTHSMVRHPAGKKDKNEFVILERNISGREYVALMKSKRDTTYSLL